MVGLLAAALLDKVVKGYNNAGTSDDGVDNYFAYKQSVYYKNAEREYESNLQWEAEQLTGRWGGQCIIFVRKFLDLTREDISGLARNTTINSDIPELGAVVVTSESSAGHVAIVIGVEPATILVVESNYGWTGRIGIREIIKSDHEIRGYYIPR